VESLIQGLVIVTTGDSLFYLVAGSALGMLLGIIPGVSSVVICSIILIFAFEISVTNALCLFLGANCGGYYSGSVSAILMNTPAHPEAMPTALDGYPMARSGGPARALGLSACSTFVGGFIGSAIVVLFLPIMDSLSNVFYPPDYSALIILAMLLVGSLGTDSIGKAVVAGGLGLLASSVGPSMITGVQRYTFGLPSLQGGISVIALALGAIVLPQMMMVFGTGTAIAWQDMTGKDMRKFELVEAKLDQTSYYRQLWRGVMETFRHWKVLIQSGIVGGITGMVPGIGGFTGNYMAYGIAKQTSRNGHLFGTGHAEGIIAPEGSSLAKEAGHIIPIVGLGIPGGITGALFLGLLAINGIKPGYGFMDANPTLAEQMLWIIFLSSFIGTVMGVVIGPRIALATKIPGPIVAPFVFVVSVAGVYITDQLMIAVWMLLGFTVFGLALRRMRYPLGGMVMGFVLGQTLETNLYLTGQLYGGFGFGFVTVRPIADVLLVLGVLVIFAKWREMRREASERKAGLASDLAEHRGDAAALEVRRLQLLNPYPLLAVLLDAFLVLLSAVVLAYTLWRYNAATGMLPLIAAAAIVLPALIFLPRDLRSYVMLRKANATRPAAVTTEQIGGAAVERSWGPHGQYRREFGSFLWILLLVALSWLFGFQLGSAIFMVAYGFVSTREYFESRVPHWTFIALSTLTTVGLLYLMFYVTSIPDSGALVQL
jgi:putative tricarboxylic transport membrane protein